MPDEAAPTAQLSSSLGQRPKNRAMHKLTAALKARLSNAPNRTFLNRAFSAVLSFATPNPGALPQAVIDLRLWR
jgi:hypothetical protein